MEKSLKWGLTGTGSIARAFAGAIPASSGAALHSVLSRREETARAFAARRAIPKIFTSLGDFTGDPDLDVVLVGSPHPFHKEQTIACLEAGKHVLCEKPMALNRGEVEAMIAAARANDRFLMEAMWMLFIPATIRGRELVAGGAIGTPGLVLADFGRAVRPDPANRFFDPALGGGTLLDMGIYPLSLAYYFFGKPDRVGGAAAIGATGVDEQIAVTLEYADGRMANLTASIRADTPCEAFIAGSEGTLRIHNDFWHAERLTLSARGSPAQVFDLPLDRPGYVHEIEHVNACIRAGRTESEIMPWSFSLDLVEMMDSLRRDWGVRYPQES
ncbi:MAG TPA: Gfo/Idh/MocA family oxidoreductase [Anaerolineales bacterium]|nr:Gfo/Idh/MocA family oxidoreductase [Anaerolineales bacterium]